MKLFIKKIIYFFKSFLNLDQLNSVELSGKLFNYSKFKFIPKTVLNVPFNLGRTARGISFKNLYDFNLPGNKQDFIGKQYIDQLNGVPHKKVIKDLLLIMKREEMLTAADIMNCPNNKRLKLYPAWSSLSPWDKFTIEEKYHTYIESFIKNRSRHGAKFICKNGKLTTEEIYSPTTAESHVNQIDKLIKSIRNKGFMKSDKSPRAYILVNNHNEWRWIMSSEGNHRSYLFYLFDVEKLTVIIEDVVYRESLKSSFNVKNGLYTLEEAENIFDGIFNGNSYIRGII